MVNGRRTFVANPAYKSFSVVNFCPTGASYSRRAVEEGSRRASCFLRTWPSQEWVSKLTGGRTWEGVGFKIDGGRPREGVGFKIDSGRTWEGVGFNIDGWKDLGRSGFQN